jgi:hypothetical protein
MTSETFQPFRWDCETSGCYNKALRPNFAVFANCLPGKISFTDVDATVEVNGRFLFLEFRSTAPADMKTGQRLYFERLTRLSSKIIAIAVYAHVPDMEVSHIRVIRRGIVGPLEAIDLRGLQDRIQKWAEYSAMDYDLTPATKKSPMVGSL